MNMISKIVAEIVVNPNDLDLPQTPANDATVADILSIVFAVLGAAALMVIVLSGLRYTLSRGDADKITKARNTIVYAVIGLILSLLAFTIVRFVVRSVG